MPTQQVSEASNPYLPQVGARNAHVRPHLVVRERLSPAQEADDSPARELSVQRPRRLRRVLGQNAVLITRHGDTPTVIRSWSTRAFFKRVFDVGGAVALGLVFSPLIATIVVMLRFKGGEVLYRHRRIGRDGEVFECLKFRSMVPDADRVLRDLLEINPELKAEWVRDHKLRIDPRVTGLGRFLRRTSLDELPQIWNVLRGEMSLVGPRPVVREELMRYGRFLPIYLSAKPGITGLWQVTGRNDTDYRRRVALDAYYVRNQNLLFDLLILLRTTTVVLGGAGAY